MSTDYKQKYEEALARAKQIHNGAHAQLQGWLEGIFPELKDNFEKTKQEIIAYLKGQKAVADFGADVATFNEWIDWVESQSEPRKLDVGRIMRIYNHILRNRNGGADAVYQQEQDAEWLLSLIKLNH